MCSTSYCGADCTKCPFNANCPGCHAVCDGEGECKCIAAKYIKLGGTQAFDEFKAKLCAEINALGIEGMPECKDLNCLVGSFVNLAYPLPNGTKAQFLEPERIYLGNQLECEFGGDRCFGVLADTEFIIVSSYGCNGADPELIIYKKR